MPEELYFILHDFSLAAVPIFFAMNCLGVLPVFISLTSPLEEAKKRRVVRSAVFTAFGVSGAILVAGKLIFRFLGITPDDFRIGGGIVLMIVGILDLLFSQFKQRDSPEEEAGIVPIGIPLIVGPAVLTTIMMLVDKFGYLVTLAALVINLLLVWGVFLNSEVIVRLMGKSGTRAFGKVASLFLVAIAVMMIRVGITNTLYPPGP
jgi:multiple antibiotic resistance protein